MDKQVRVLVLMMFFLSLLMGQPPFFNINTNARDSRDAGQEKPREHQDPKGGEKLKEREKTSPLPADTLSFDGEITGGKDNIIVVTDAQQAEHSLTLTEQTRVTRGGKSATRADLKMSDNVRVQAKRTGDGTLVALSLDIAGE